MTTVDLQCDFCQKKFERDEREYRYARKNGRTKFYCNLSCSTSATNKLHSRGNTKNLRSANRRDALSPFRWFVARARYRGSLCLTAEDAESVWRQQKGVCPFTGWNLVLPTCASGWAVPRHPKNASLDRIDNSKGYEKVNLRFVALIANLARNTFADEALLDFCRAVASQHSAGSISVYTLQYEKVTCDHVQQER